jgi:response regulator of citrate/malate metabolism
MSTQRIFVLDDDMNRINWFTQTFGSIDYAHTVDAAKSILENNIYDIIFLDHDLGGPYTSGPDGDGIDLAQWMASERIQLNAQIIVHSLNYDGAKNISKTLSASHNVTVCNFIQLMNATKND